MPDYNTMECSNSHANHPNSIMINGEYQETFKVILTEGNLTTTTNLEEPLPSALAKSNPLRKVPEKVLFDDKSNRIFVVDNWKQHNTLAKLPTVYDEELGWCCCFGL